MAFRIDVKAPAQRHLRMLTAAQQALVSDAIEDQLTHQPAVETRNRKKMKENRLATWELRVRNLRVYYDVEEETDEAVTIQAIGVKIRDRVYIAGKEYHL